MLAGLDKNEYKDEEKEKMSDLDKDKYEDKEKDKYGRPGLELGKDKKKISWPAWVGNVILGDNNSSEHFVFVQ